MGQFFDKKFTPLLYAQNDQHVIGIILRYVRWGTHRPPPPPPGTGFGSTKGGGGGGRSTTPEIVEHPSESHPALQPPPCVCD